MTLGERISFVAIEDNAPLLSCGYDSNLITQNNLRVDIHSYIFK